MAPTHSGSRRSLLQLSAATALLAATTRASARKTDMMTVVTFGDSILDCARYNEYGVHPGQLIVRNDDALFPAFRGRDIASLRPVRLEHRAVDGGRVEDLPDQMRGLRVPSPAIALITVGGNNLLGGLASDPPGGIATFQRRLDSFVRALPIRPALLGTVYDPTFGDDSRNFLGVDARLARASLNRINSAITDVAVRYGEVIDLHGHFLDGDASWYTRTIEPSVRGASEVRAAFLPAVLAFARVN